MSEIVLNEREWVEDAIARRDLGRKPVETISRYARYLYADGYRKNEISSRIEDFMIKCDPTINIVKWQKMIDIVTKGADRYPLIDVDGVGITEAEMEMIGTLNGRMLQRLMFTLLCVAKYRNAVNSDNNSWVNSDAKEIFLLANIKVTNKRQSLLVNDLWQTGMIGYSRIVDNVNINVKIVDDSGDYAMYISDFRNLGNQYMMAVGEKYIRCHECGLVVRRTSNKQHYCSDCAVMINRQKTLEAYHSTAA